MNFDTGSIVNWVQLGIWLYIALAYFQPNLMAKIKIPPMSRDKLIPALICAGIIFSGYSLYAQYLKEPSWEITEVVSGKTFCK